MAKSKKKRILTSPTKRGRVILNSRIRGGGVVGKMSCFLEYEGFPAHIACFYGQKGPFSIRDDPVAAMLTYTGRI